MQNAQHQNRKSICIMLNVIVHSHLSSQSVVNSKNKQVQTESLIFTFSIYSALAAFVTKTWKAQE